MALMEKPRKTDEKEGVPQAEHKRVNPQAVDIRAPIRSVIANVKVAEEAYAQATPEEKKELDTLYKKMHYAGIRLGASIMGGVSGLALATGCYSLALEALRGGALALQVAALPGVGLDGVVAIGTVGFTLAGSSSVYFAWEVFRAARDWVRTETLKNDKLTEVRDRGAAGA